jgi:hypothetical protein
MAKCHRGETERETSRLAATLSQAGPLSAPFQE